MKKIILIVSLIVIAGVIFVLEQNRPGKGIEKIDVVLMTDEEKELRYISAKEITTPDGFINTEAITIRELVGKKVVLVDFWTYSCINCQRTTPYLNAWHEKYGDKGLTIIGIHTPEFEFEKKYENVQDAVKRFGINYPVVLDNDFSTWHAYNNRYWPRKYLIDIDGYIVYDHIGEGGYDETERVIQKLLEERNIRLALNESINTDIAEIENARTPEAESPEIYFGAWRNDRLGNGTARVEGIAFYTIPEKQVKNIYYLGGTWNTTYEFTELIDESDTVSEGNILFQYEAKNVNLVAASDLPVVIEVSIDGKPVPSFMRGRDISVRDGNTFITVHGERLYEIIRDNTGVSEHMLDLYTSMPGLKIFTFTFG